VKPHLIILPYHSCQLWKINTREILLWGPTRRRAEKIENMESLDRWKWHFQSLLYLIHQRFGSFYLDIQNHIVEYPRVRGCMKWWFDYQFLAQWCELFQKKNVLCNLTQMKALLIVKMCNKANIFKNQLGYFRNPWDINKLWAHREVLVKSVMLMVDPVRVGNYALYTCIVICIFFNIYWVNSSLVIVLFYNMYLYSVFF
jgi:hypothetical protein